MYLIRFMNQEKIDYVLFRYRFGLYHHWHFLHKGFMTLARVNSNGKSRETLRKWGFFPNRHHYAREPFHRVTITVKDHFTFYMRFLGWVFRNRRGVTGSKIISNYFMQAPYHFIHANKMR